MMGQIIVAGGTVTARVGSGQERYAAHPRHEVTRVDRIAAVGALMKLEELALPKFKYLGRAVQ